MRHRCAGARKPRTRWCCCSASRFPPISRRPLRWTAQTILADIPAGLPSDLLTRRPDIMQAEATLRGANANIGAARAAFFPTISLTGRSGHGELGARQGCSRPGSLAWSFLPSITLPIFEGGQLQASLDVATVQKDINVAQYEKTIQTAFREVADGLAARGTYDDEVGVARALTPRLSRARLDLSEMRFRNGVDTYLDRAHGANRFVQRPADAGGGAPGAPHQPRRPVPLPRRRVDRTHRRRAASGRRCWIDRAGKAPLRGFFATSARERPDRRKRSRTHLKLLRRRFAREPLDECG